MSSISPRLLRALRIPRSSSRSSAMFMLTLSPRLAVHLSDLSVGLQSEVNTSVIKLELLLNVNSVCEGLNQFLTQRSIEWE